MAFKTILEIVFVPLPPKTIFFEGSIRETVILQQEKTVLKKVNLLECWTKRIQQCYKPQELQNSQERDHGP